VVVTPVGGDSYAYAIVRQPDGKLVVGGSTSPGSNRDGFLARYNTDGTLDATFGTGGIVRIDVSNQYDDMRALALQADGKLVLAGTNLSDFVLARVGTDGTLDPTFGNGGRVAA